MFRALKLSYNACRTSKGGDRVRILNFIRQLTTQQNKKIFNDPVHGHIEVHPLCVKIIDTPQFQRLRDLKQIGACYFVYPGASHNRFEHCIGVSHLAGKLTRQLQQEQPELGITKTDILCVEIAGLCHDLGHGPFSHLFDAKFIQAVKPELKWKHETGSVMMFKYLIKNNDLEKEFEKYGVYDRDVNFIVEQIERPNNGTNGEWHYKGREKSKEYLYEVVANKRNGIDVDKMEYFARDCHGLGIPNTFDHNRFMKFVRVIKVDGRFQICSRDKMTHFQATEVVNKYKINRDDLNNVYSTFLRPLLEYVIAAWDIYCESYCNKLEQLQLASARIVTDYSYITMHSRDVSCAFRVQLIRIVDALIAADEIKLVPKKDGSLIKISDCIECPEAYTRLSDSIFHVILMSTDEKLKDARSILQRILQRKLYGCIGETSPKQTTCETNTIKLTKQIMSYILQESNNEVKETDIYIDIVCLNYGDNTKNPIDKVRFYNKFNMDEAIRINRDRVSLMLTNVFAEHIIRVYFKTTDRNISEQASTLFEKWCGSNGYQSQKRIQEDV